MDIDWTAIGFQTEQIEEALLALKAAIEANDEFAAKRAANYIKVPFDELCDALWGDDE